MSIKLFDTDCTINLFEKMRSFDCIPYLSNYKIIFTEQVVSETNNDRFELNVPFEYYKLSSDEEKLYSEISDYVGFLGKGERSVIVHALNLSNEHDHTEEGHIVILSMDREAGHHFRNDILKDPQIRKTYPNAEKILWVGASDFLKKMWDEGAIPEQIAPQIYREIRPILGKKIDFLKQ